MTQIKKILPLLISTFFFTKIGHAQNLTPRELEKINNDPDVASITRMLAEKGFKFEDSKTNDNTKEVVSRWYFQTFANPGEDVSSFLVKVVDSSKRCQTRFSLYNPFNYKEFFNNVVKDKYNFTGTQMIKDKSYFVFRHKKRVLMSAEQKSRNKTVYEIIIDSE